MRLKVVGVIAIALFGVMVVRLWSLQVLQTARYTQTVTANQLRLIRVPAPRGLILSRSGTTMVDNGVSQEITLTEAAARQDPQVVGALAALLGMTPTAVEQRLAGPNTAGPYAPATIMANAPLSAVETIAENPSLFPGVLTPTVTHRSYPLGDTGAQLWGYVGPVTAAELHHMSPGVQAGDQVGQSGLEAQYNKDLTGTAGAQKVEVDAQGQMVGTLGTTPPVPGDNLVTHIDLGLEQTLQQALDQQVATLSTVDPHTGQTIGATGGAAVALDPQTGAVLAMVSNPTYNPSWWVGGITTAHYQQLTASNAHQPLMNRAIDGLYTPGSTFKLATASAALHDGLITPSFEYYDNGTFVVPGCHTGCQVFHDALGENPGWITVTPAIAISSDDFFYNLGALFWQRQATYGQTPIQQMANRYSFGEETGIDLPGETNAARVDSPQVVAKEHAQYPKAYPNSGWYTGNNIEMAFGQGGTLITPVEEAVAYGTFANGGTRYVPQLAAALTDSSGSVVQTFAPKVAGHVTLSAADRQAMLQGFEGAILDPAGTAYQAFQGYPYGQLPIAGKTGTASVNGTVPTAWFVAFGPVPHPQYVIAAVVEQGGYGSVGAAPIVRAGFQYLISHPVAPLALHPGSTVHPGPASPTTTPTTTTTTAPGG
jgi:penicillin-binding protein 2